MYSLKWTVMLIFRRRFERVEVACPIRSHFQDRCKVPTSVAIVGCRPHRTEPIIVQDIVALHTQLMRSQDVRHMIAFKKVLDDGGTKRITSTARRYSKLFLIRIRIRPNKIRHSSLMRDFAEPIQDLDLINVMDGRRKTAMDTEDVVVNHN